jgi:hypothetical protein
VSAVSLTINAVQVRLRGIVTHLGWGLTGLVDEAIVAEVVDHALDDRRLERVAVDTSAVATC